MKTTKSLIKLSDRMDLLPPYLFGKINKVKLKKRRAGIDIIDLAMGNPSDPTPQPVIDKLREAVQDPRTHRYSVAAGIYNFRKELAKYYETHYQVSLNPDNEVLSTIEAFHIFPWHCWGQGILPSSLSLPFQYIFTPLLLPAETS